MYYATFTKGHFTCVQLMSSRGSLEELSVKLRPTEGHW